jgi:hypothetical protein
MQESLKEMTTKIKRDSRASDWMIGFKAGVRVEPMPRLPSRDFRRGYTEGREVTITRLMEWLAAEGLTPMDHAEALNLLMRS